MGHHFQRYINDITKCLYKSLWQQTDIEIAAQEIRRMRTELTEIYVKHNSKGKTFEEVNADIERDNFMTANEALEYGLIDEIVDKRP